MAPALIQIVSFPTSPYLNTISNDNSLMCSSFIVTLRLNRLFTNANIQSASFLWWIIDYCGWFIVHCGDGTHEEIWNSPVCLLQWALNWVHWPTVHAELRDQLLFAAVGWQCVLSQVFCRSGARQRLEKERFPTVCKFMHGCTFLHTS